MGRAVRQDVTAGVARFVSLLPAEVFRPCGPAGGLGRQGRPLPKTR